MLVLYKAQLSATTVAFAQEHVTSQQQESLLPRLNPLPSLLAMGQALGSPLGSILACCFSHLFPVCCRSELTSYPSGNEFLLSGNTEEHPFTFFIPLSFSSFHHATLSLDFLLELASFLLTLSVSLPFFTLVPARFFGQLSRNVTVTEDQKWSNCVIA